MHNVTFALLYVTIGWVFIFVLITKTPKVIFLAPFSPKAKWISLRLKEVPLCLTPNFSQHEVSTVANSHETDMQPQLQKQAQYCFDDLLSSILFIINYLLQIG